MLLGTHCPHCPAVLRALSELVKAGTIGRLEVVNIERRPDLAEQYRVRSVPWVRLGPFELDGPRSMHEYQQWAERAGTVEGTAAYYAELLATGRLAPVVAGIRAQPASMVALIRILDDEDTELTVRVGVGAVVEEFAGDAVLRGAVDELIRLTRHADPRVRGDACHYLGLSGDPRAVPHAQALLTDSDGDVRDSAAEALARLSAVQGANRVSTREPASSR